jgi:peptide/nickel transport system substrate-binding protein
MHLGIGQRLRAFAIASLVLVFPALQSPASAEKVLTAALYANLNNLDPVKMTTGQEYNYALSVFDGITYIDRDMSVKPDLAERWDTSDDLKVWTFFLRKGVKFHNGRELEAEDVLATLNRILDPANGSRMRVNLAIVDKVEAVDRHTGRFTLKEPYSGFDALLADYQARISPREAAGELSTKPIGTGPFRFVEFIPNDRLVVEKNPDYWRPGQPKVDRIIYRIIPEYASAVAALENGEVQVVWNLPPEEIDKLKTSATARADEVTAGTWYAYVMRNDIPPFNDLKVRQAFFKLIDKATIADIASLGHGVATHTPIPPSHPAFNHDIPIAKQDIEGAKRLLAEAGHPDGMKVVLWMPKEPVYERFAVGMRDLAKAGGVEVELKSVSTDQFFAEIEGKEPFTVTNFYGRPTPDTMVYSWFHSQGSWNQNLWKFKDAEVDQVLDKARAAKSVEEQTALYKRFQEILVERGPGPVVFVFNHANGVHNSVLNFHSSPRQWIDFREVDLKP